jgi:hypothetical protein
MINSRIRRTGLVLLTLLFACAFAPLPAQEEENTYSAGIAPAPFDHGRYLCLGLLNLSVGLGGFYISAGVPLVAQVSLDVDLRGEGSGIHLGLTTLPAALYIDLDRNGIGLQLDTIVATGFHLRSGFPGLSVIRHPN